MPTASDRPSAPSRLRPTQVPKTTDFSDTSLDILDGLLSFYIRSLNGVVSRDLDQKMTVAPFARGTGKITTLLMVCANPGIRPSVVAHFLMKDRSALVRIIDQLVEAGLIEQRVVAAERRARGLYLTERGAEAARRVRSIAQTQSDEFFGMLSRQEQETVVAILRKAYRAIVDAQEEALIED
jgi:DNA-binding MarR family transcriptional regulator